MDMAIFGVSCLNLGVAVHWADHAKKNMSQEIVSECLNCANRHSCAEPRHQFGDSGGEIMSHGHSYRRCRWFSPFLFFAFDAATATRAGRLGWGFYLRYRWSMPKQASFTETPSTPARKEGVPPFFTLLALLD